MQLCTSSKLESWKPGRQLLTSPLGWPPLAASPASVLLWFLSFSQYSLPILSALVLAFSFFFS